MIVVERRGDMFTTDLECITNPVNSVGIMGAGLALAFKRRYPKQCDAFNEESRLFARNSFIDKELIRPMLYQRTIWGGDKTILMFPTKIVPSRKSELSWVVRSADIAAELLTIGGVGGVAMPKVGCGLGGLDWAVVKPAVIEAIEKKWNGTLEFWE